MNKRLISIILVFNCLLICFAIPMVDKKYDSEYHKYYCSELFENSENGVITALEDCKYYVIAYDPGSSTKLIIQFREKRDAMNLIQQYKNITSSLSSNESLISLDYYSEKICNLIRCYVKQYYVDMDYISLGELYRYAIPLQQYQTLEEYEASQKKKNERSGSSSQYRPCSLF